MKRPKQRKKLQRKKLKKPLLGRREQKAKVQQTRKLRKPPKMPERKLRRNGSKLKMKLLCQINQ